MYVLHSFVGAVTIGTQTSLTDLSNLNKITQVQTVETQTERFNHHIAIDTTTTTSSSQNEGNALLNKYPIEANVTHIQVISSENR